MAQAGTTQAGMAAAGITQASTGTVDAAAGVMPSSGMPPAEELLRQLTQLQQLRAEQEWQRQCLNKSGISSIPAATPGLPAGFTAGLGSAGPASSMQLPLRNAGVDLTPENLHRLMTLNAAASLGHLGPLQSAMLAQVTTPSIARPLASSSPLSDRLHQPDKAASAGAPSKMEINGVSSPASSAMQLGGGGGGGLPRIGALLNSSSTLAPKALKHLIRSGNANGSVSGMNLMLKASHAPPLNHPMRTIGVVANCPKTNGASVASVVGA